MRKVLVMAATTLRRFGRDRTNIVFGLAFPLALIMMIGLQFGGDPEVRVAVAGGDGTVAAAVVDDIADRVDLEVVDLGPGSAAETVREGDVDVAIAFPDDLDDDVARGRPVEVQVATTRGDPSASRVRQILDDAVLRATAAPTAVHAAVERGADRAAAEDAAEGAAGIVGRVEVAVTTTGEETFPDDLGGADVGAPSQLVLFVIVTGLSGSYVLIQDRIDGLLARLAATPTGPGAIIAGAVLGRFLIGLAQGVAILAGSTLLFGVDWGDPVGAAAVVVMIAAVGAGAGMCFGAFFSRPEQASGIGIVTALSVAAIGGAMLPIELFGDTMASIARFTPHYWAIDAFAVLIRHDGGLTDVATDLAVLAAWATVLVALATWRLRRRPATAR